MTGTIKKIAFVALLLTVAILLAACAQNCDGCGGEEPTGEHESTGEHEHTFAQEWSYDDTYHWHAATCEHTDLTADKAEHNWSDEVIAEGVIIRTCTVCGKQIATGEGILDSYTVELWGYENGEYKLLDTKTVAAQHDLVFTCQSDEEANGKVFVGWEYAQYDPAADEYTLSFVNIVRYGASGVIKVNAKYETPCVVTFMEYNGNTFREVHMYKGATVTAPDGEPTRYGYEFDGWDYDFTKAVTADTVIHAKYVKICAVTFLGQDGKLLEKKTVRTGGAVSCDAPVLDGYTFAYWSDGTVDGDKRLTDVSAALNNVTEDMSVRAVYTLTGYSVRFYSNGGLIEEQNVKPYGFAVEPDMTRFSYIYDWSKKAAYGFSGWDKDFSLITGDMEIHAQYATPVPADTPIVAVRADYKNIDPDSMALTENVDVSFVLLYNNDIRGLTIGVKQSSSLLVYTSSEMFQGSQDIPGGYSESSFSQNRDMEKDILYYCEDYTWASSSTDSVTINKQREVLRIKFSINKIAAETGEGAHWIYLDDNTYIVDKDLKKSSPILISDYVKVLPADQAE